MYNYGDDEKINSDGFLVRRERGKEGQRDRERGREGERHREREREITCA